MLNRAVTTIAIRGHPMTLRKMCILHFLVSPRVLMTNMLSEVRFIILRGAALDDCIVS